MPAITNFTHEDLLNVQEQYNDMMCAVEERIIEIAHEMGKSYQLHQISDVYFEHDQLHIYIIAEMHMSEFESEDEEYEYYKINIKWLFSDDYKKELNEKEEKRKREEAEEYKEYLRLKAKFEPNR